LQEGVDEARQADVGYNAGISINIIGLCSVHEIRMGIRVEIEVMKNGKK
jgi:hypothetical protein